jgi:cytochrome c553
MTRPSGARARFSAAALLVAACGGVPAGPAPGKTFTERFLEDRAFRRSSLEAAVVNRANGYSALRLAEYAVEHDGVAVGWDALDVWNPPVRPVRLGESEDVPAPVFAGGAVDGDAEWLALGRDAFERYPVEIDDAVTRLARDADARSRFGLWTDDRGVVAGLVYATTADGTEHAAWTCSGCHARPDANGRLVHGAPAASLDRGAMASLAPDGSEPESWSWGPGRLDVTADGMNDPTAIPDLRATAHQSHLHWEATLRNGLPALAVRIETLLVENAHERFRPPRDVAVALALYVESLGARGEPGDAEHAPEGARVFAASCGGCHHADGSTEAPLPVDAVGTDRRAADSPMRGNGVYRIPSLWAVGDRGQYLHDGSVRDLATFLDPARLESTQGHPFGLDLQDEDRARLLEFLVTIGR